MTFKIIQLKGDEAIKAIQKLFNQNLNGRKLDHLNWQYNQVPNGSISLFIQREDGIIVGTLSVIISQLDHFGSQMKLAHAIDAVVDEKFRKKGLFMDLLNAMDKQMLKENISMIYGFPSKNSAHAFFNKWEFKKLNPTPFMIKLIGFNYILKKLKITKDQPIELFTFLNELPLNENIKTITKFNHEFRLVWNKFSNGELSGLIRDANYLNWRYFKNPSHPYRSLGYYDMDGNLCGYITASIQKKHGANLLYIMELIFDKKQPKIGKALLKEMITLGKKANAEVSLCWNRKSYPNHSSFSSMNYFNLPEWIRPIELQCGYKPFAEHFIINRDNFYISYADSDSV